MLSHTTASIIASYNFILDSPALPRRSLFLLPVPEPRTRRGRRWTSTPGLELVRRSGFCFRGAIVVRCDREWRDGGRDSGLDLEREILEFMRGSEYPDRFPTRRQLVEAGRMDLAEAILERGGWLSLGWDVDEKDAASVAPRRVEAENVAVLSKSIRFNDNDLVRASNSSFELSRVSPEVDSAGIEGILSRLQKERNLTFGVGLRVNGSHGHVPYHGIDDRLSQDSADLAVAGQERSHESASIYINGHSRDNMSQQMILSKMDVSKNSLQPEMSWRTWTSERLGSLNSEFEAAEIDFNENHIQQDHEMQKLTMETSEPSNRGEEAEICDGMITHNELKSRLRHLQLQLSSVLALLRSKSEASEIEQKPTNNLDSLQIYSDAWEFQENEIMAAKDMLRSIRAKLSVLEGKMALATSDAQKIVEERQKQIDAARRALQDLRTTCVVWPNHANEVLLTGSFDGWTSEAISIIAAKTNVGLVQVERGLDSLKQVSGSRPSVRSHPRWETHPPMPGARPGSNPD